MATAASSSRADEQWDILIEGIPAKGCSLGLGPDDRWRCSAELVVVAPNIPDAIKLVKAEAKRLGFKASDLDIRSVALRPPHLRTSPDLTPTGGGQ